jgi:hypothetical protein
MKAMVTKNERVAERVGTQMSRAQALRLKGLAEEACQAEQCATDLSFGAQGGDRAGRLVLSWCLPILRLEPRGGVVRAQDRSISGCHPCRRAAARAERCLTETVDRQSHRRRKHRSIGMLSVTRFIFQPFADHSVDIDALASGPRRGRGCALFRSRPPE